MSDTDPVEEATRRPEGVPLEPQPEGSDPVEDSEREVPAEPEEEQRPE